MSFYFKIKNNFRFERKKFTEKFTFSNMIRWVKFKLNLGSFFYIFVSLKFQLKSTDLFRSNTCHYFSIWPAFQIFQTRDLKCLKKNWSTKVEWEGSSTSITRKRRYLLEIFLDFKKKEVFNQKLRVQTLSDIINCDA